MEVSCEKRLRLRSVAHQVVAPRECTMVSFQCEVCTMPVVKITAEKPPPSVREFQQSATNPRRPCCPFPGHSLSFSILAGTDRSLMLDIVWRILGLRRRSDQEEARCPSWPVSDCIVYLPGLHDQLLRHRLQNTHGTMLFSSLTPSYLCVGPSSSVDS